MIDLHLEWNDFEIEYLSTMGPVARLLG